MNQPPHLTREPVPGDLLGEFRILHEIGAGAMGKVYEARQESLQRRVALKVLPDEARGTDANAVTRFYREARAAAQLNHPNIVPVYGFGVEGGSYYFAMQFVQGCSLQERIQKGLSERELATYMLHVSRGLDAAHAQGVIHRDIKPANIMIREEDDQAVMTDFGLSRHERVKSITQSGALLGTPVYMSPEQARGDKVDARADVYGVGATFYEALTGRIPFTETSLRALLVAITTTPPTAPSEIRPDVSPDLEAIVLKAMAKEPRDRYPNCRALADDLLRFLRGEIVRARSASPVEVAISYLRRNPLVLVLANLLVAVVVVGLIAVPWLVRRGPAAAATDGLSAARDLLGELGARYADALVALEQARTAREAEVRTLEKGGGDGSFARARFAAQELEDALFAAPDAPGAAALGPLRRAVAAGPEDHPATHEARELLALLLTARERSARRLGELRLAGASAGEAGALVGRDDLARGTLSVETVPPGAKLFLYEVRLVEGAFSLEGVQALGRTPLAAPPELAPGEYLIKLHANERVETTIPVRIEPGRATRLTLELPALDGVPPGFLFVPPGEFLAGGDPLAVRPLFRTPEPVWVDGFFVGQYEVRVKEYVDFLAELEPAARRAHLPVGVQSVRVVGGRLESDPDVLEHPIAGISPASARAYCEWRTAQSPGGPRFRLPSDVEWEKAARGPLAWAFPWGERFDPGASPPRAHLHQLDASDGIPTRACGTHPGDVSVYGLLDAGGNVSEWVTGSFGASDRFAVLRGGSWLRGPEPTRAASREAVHVDHVAAVAQRAGFRLAFDPLH